MSNVIKEYQEALNTTPPLKVNIAPAFTPPAGVQDPASPPTPIIPASAFPSAPTQASPIPEQPQIQPTTSSLLEVPPTPTGDTALSYGETVSRLSAQSAQEIQKILAESGQPKPNEVQKQLLGSSNPIQIDPKLTSQNNPFKSSREPRNAAERLAFEPPVLPNGMRNAFSNPNARAAIAAGISKGEYLDYIQSLRDKGAQYVGFGERDVDNGGFTNVTGQRVIETEDFTGLSADQIRQKMKDRTGFYSTQRAFNQSFLPFLGDDRGSLETLFGVLAFPANLVRGVTADTVIRPAAALISGGFDVEAIKKAYEEMRPTRGGTFTGAAILGEQFQSLAVTGEKGKPFNPFAAVRDDKNLLQVGGAFLFDLGADPLNFEVGKAFNRFRRNTVAPPPITPEVLPPVRELPPSNVAGVLPEARTIDVEGRVIITPPNPVQSNRVITPPYRRGTTLPYTTDRLMIEGTLDVPVQFFPKRTGNEGVARVPLPELRIPEPVKPEGVALPKLDLVPERPAPLPDLSAIPYKRAEPELAASYESLARYEPSEVVFPVPREPYTPPVVRYHGSSSPVTELKNDFFNKDNIYGNGFYTTRDRSVAETYQKKGASEGTGEGYLYQVDSSNDKLFNLDDVIPAQIRESVRLNAPNSGRLGVLYKEAERLLNGGKSYGLGGKVVTSTAELFDAVRIFSKRVTVETGEDGFAKFVDSFKPELQKSGYTGFTHEGGRLTRGKRHQVDILWSPETSVKLSQLNVPKVEPADVQLYNNVTALFNDSPQLPVVQQAVREVVEQKPPEKLYRGVSKGRDPKDRSGAEGGGLFFSTDRKVAEAYAGVDGVVIEEVNNFNNTFSAANWMVAKEQIGLPRNASMSDLIKATRDAGYDSLAFNSLNGREVISLRDTPIQLPKNPILQEVVEYGRTGELTPNIAVLKGATPDEVRAIVQDKLEVMRDTPLVVPRLEVQPITIPKLEFAFQGKTGGRVTRGVRPSKRASARDSALDEWVVKFDNWYTSNRRPEYIRTGATGSDFEPLINAYIRKGDYLVNGEKVDAITFANISVSEDVRGKGIFSDILKRTEEKYPDKVLVIEEVNESSAALAKKNGFTVDSTNPNNWVKVPPDKPVPTSKPVTVVEMYHGGANKIEKLDDTYRSVDNLYGNGLYTTENIEVANSYRGKNAVDKTEEGYLYKLQEITPQKLYDLDNPLVAGTPEYTAVRKTLIEYAKVDGGEFTGVARHILKMFRNGQVPKLTEIFKSGRPLTKDSAKYAAFVDSFRTELEKLGYNGYTHTGGRSIRGFIDHKVNIYWNSENALRLEQLEPKPVPTSKPVVVTDSAIVTVADLQDAAKGIGTLGEVSQWSVRGDFITPLKEVLNAVDDLGLDVLNTPALSKMVKGGIGKLSNKTVEGVASSLQKVSLETAEDIAKSIFNALWRKSTPDQKEIILGKISATRLEQLGLERVQTKITPPTTPAPLQYVQAGVLDEVTVSAYHVVNDSQVPIEDLYQAMMRSAGFSAREAREAGGHFITEQIAFTGAVTDRNLKTLITLKSLSVESPVKQKWSSKMLQQIWEVATPEQKAYIMKNVDNLEQLGLERIARSNVIDDHLPPEGVFDTPC